MALARVCQLITQAAGIKKDSEGSTTFSTADFMPYEDGYADLNKEMSIDDLFSKPTVKESK